MRCEPASQIIRALGGLTVVAEAAGVTLTSVQRWRMPTDKGGTGGFIPRKYHAKLTTLANSKTIALPPAAFVDAEIAAANLPPLPTTESPSEAA